MSKPKTFSKVSKRSQDARKRKKATKLPSISKLIALCDKALSLDVRQTAYPKNEVEKYCYTCNHLANWKKMHCGHYISRYYKPTRWHKDNVRIQCMMCNLWKRGDPVTFRENLVAEIGEARVLAVEKLRDAPIKVSREYLEKLLFSLKNGSIQPSLEEIEAV